MADGLDALLAKDAIRDVLVDLARGTDRLDGELRSEGERDLVLGLRYFDRFERRGAQPGGPLRWKIALRRCVFDWSYTIPIAEKWPFAEHFTVGRRDRTDPSYRRE